MYQIKIDTQQNRLEVVFSGTVDAKQAERYLHELERRVPTELQAGFEIQTDLRRMQHLSQAATRHIRKTMDLFNRQGVSRIVRIISHPTGSFAFNLMSYFHYDHKVRIITCESPEELARKTPSVDLAS